MAMKRTRTERGGEIKFITKMDLQNLNKDSLMLSYRYSLTSHADEFAVTIPMMSLLPPLQKTELLNIEKEN